MREAAQTGQVMVREALVHGTPWGDNALNEYINRLGQNLALNSGSRQVFSFYVLYNPRVNAQSFPGGYIVINSGVVGLAENEAELASVLAHEIAHENSCDWRTGESKGNLFELIALVPAVVFGGPAGIALVAGEGWAATLARARSSRSAEERADLFAAQYLIRAGYDPHAAARFFGRLQAEQERTMSESRGLLATHPRTADRKKQLEMAIPNLPPPEFTVHDETEFPQMQREIHEYDEMYDRLMNTSASGAEKPLPQLSRRPTLTSAR
jgi:beta-barrel assembly-enhancing protease